MLRKFSTNGDACAIVIRLFRLWGIAREDGEVGLGRMYEVARELRLPDEAATACASLFELIESKMGRSLVRECCCSRTLSTDETALLSLIQAVPVLQVFQGSIRVPHGVPGAILWAALAVRRATGWPGQDEPPVEIRQSSEGCPFLSALSEKTRAV